MATSMVPKKAMAKELLFENSNSSSSYPASTLISDVDLTKYSYLEICVNDRNVSKYGYRKFYSEVPSSGSASFVVSYASRAVIAERYFDLTPTSVTCRGGSYFNAIGGNPVASDGFVIPYRIYGVIE